MGFNPAGTGNGQPGFPHRRRGFCRSAPRGLLQAASAYSSSTEGLILAAMLLTATMQREFSFTRTAHIFSIPTRSGFSPISAVSPIGVSTSIGCSPKSAATLSAADQSADVECALQFQSRRDRCGGAFRSGSHPKKRDQDQRGRHFEQRWRGPEKFFRGYTRKQWGLDLSDLSAGVAARIPTRTNDDDRYFSDTFQFMPAQGYTKMFERMLDHPNIETRLAIDFFAVRESLAANRLYTPGRSKHIST